MGGAVEHLVLRVGYEVVWRLRRRANVGIGPYDHVVVFSVWRMEIIRLGRVKTLPYNPIIGEADTLPIHYSLFTKIPALPYEVAFSLSTVNCPLHSRPSPTMKTAHRG